MKKKFMLRVMAWLLAVAMLLPSAGNLFTAYAEEGKVAYSGKVEIQGKSESWWNAVNPTLEELLGDVKPEDVIKVVFYGNAFLPGYNTTGDGDWKQPADFVKELVAEDIWFGNGYALQIGVSIAPGDSATVKWDVYTKDGAGKVTETPKEEKPASGDLVFNFAELTPGGYGYEATVNGNAVDVSIKDHYQEIQYVLPKTVDLAAYTTLVVDVTSNLQLDIKLVDPKAEVNQYNQLTPFLDKYTGNGAVTAPVSIDLAEFADMDLSQINFMAVEDGTTFTIKSITFTGAKQVAPKATATPKPTATPTPTPVPITEDTYKTVGDVLLVTEDMVKNGTVTVERAQYNSIIIPADLKADVLLKTVKADEIVVEGGADYTVTLYYCDIEKVNVTAPEAKIMTLAELNEALNAKDADVNAIVAEYKANVAAKKAAEITQVEVAATYFTTVKEINVKASAKIDANDCEVDKINLAVADVEERMNVTVVDYNGALSANLDRAEGEFAALFTLELESSKISTLDVTGADSACFIEDEASVVDVLNVADAANITLDATTGKVVVAEETTGAKVRVYSKVNEVVVKGDANSIVLPTCAEIGNAVVEGNNVKVYGYGKLESAVITGTGANVVVYGAAVEGDNDFTPPKAMLAMSPQKEPERESSNTEKPEEEVDPNKTYTLADLPVSGYGYTVDGNKVTFSGQYQEIRYALPEQLTVGDYESLTINIVGTEGGAVAIKLLDSADKQIAVQYGKTATFTWALAGIEDQTAKIAKVALMANDAASSVEATTVVFVPVPGAGEGGEGEEDENLTLTLSMLPTGGYGYTLAGDKVTFSGQYQEIRYTLPEELTVADYLSMTVNIKSTEGGSVAIKLLDSANNTIAIKYGQTATYTWDLTTIEDQTAKIARIGLMANDAASSVEVTTAVFVPNPEAGEESNQLTVELDLYSEYGGDWNSSNDAGLPVSELSKFAGDIQVTLEYEVLDGYDYSQFCLVYFGAGWAWTEMQYIHTAVGTTQTEFTLTEADLELIKAGESVGVIFNPNGVWLKKAVLKGTKAE